jgi:hypothetical protein
MFSKSGFLSVVIGIVLAASGAQAATFMEQDAPGGAFGNRFDTFTQIGAGYGGVSGTGDQNRFDHLVFTDLPAGSQSIGFDFFAPEGIGNSYSAGGVIRYSTSPFRYEWDGTALSNFQLDLRNPTGHYALALPDSYSGSLYVALYFTHGKDIGYNISVPQNVAAPAAPVPLPAGIGLLGMALGALGLLRARRAGGHKPA